MKTSFVLAALIAAGLSSAASAQSAAKDFSYKAPSGMFGEGTTKWQNYQFMENDAQKRAQGEISTGAISNSSSSGQSYPRPGERSSSPRRTTSH